MQSKTKHQKAILLVIDSILSTGQQILSLF